MKISKINSYIVPNKVKNFFKFKDSKEFVAQTYTIQDKFQYSNEFIDNALKKLEFEKPKFKKSLNPKLQRTFDCAVAAILAPVVLSVLGVATVLSKISNPKVPINYTSKRIGYLGKEFDVYKFTTILGEAQNKPATSGFTKYLRKHSFDEFPQIFNVLKGDMSFVGPRAMRRKEVNMLINNTDISSVERFFVKPGFGYGNQTEKTNMKFRRQVEKENLNNMSVKTYFKTLYNLAKNVLCGRNK